MPMVWNVLKIQKLGRYYHYFVQTHNYSSRLDYYIIILCLYKITISVKYVFIDIVTILTLVCLRFCESVQGPFNLLVSRRTIFVTSLLDWNFHIHKLMLVLNNIQWLKITCRKNKSLIFSDFTEIEKHCLEEMNYVHSARKIFKNFLYSSSKILAILRSTLPYSRNKFFVFFSQKNQTKMCLLKILKILFLNLRNAKLYF